MKISVVTISFNQAEFLERTILSVLNQTGVDVEYIIVDPGSTDGSREIIERYRDRFSHIIYEKDKGPADGLNKGFAVATGDIYCYLNSDDTFEPDALLRVAGFMRDNADVGVVCGHAWIIDNNDVRLRRVWSEPFGRLMVAYGAAIQIQPSTFIRRDVFVASDGFNIDNRSNWDGELLVDLFLSNVRIKIIDEFLSCYRLHSVSITNSGKLGYLIEVYGKRRFEKLVGRRYYSVDKFIAILFHLLKYLSRPRAFLERIRYGSVYRRGVVDE